jgi:nucleoside-diphosphate-sugar epimerase
MDHLKVLVTGGTGFVGSHLVEALLRQGTEVRCLLRKGSGLRWLKGLSIEEVRGDCDDPESLREAVKDVDQVFHLAGVTKAVREETFFRVNALGTDNLIHACLERNARLQRFVYVSSQAAAGPCRNGRRKTESDECDPVSPYGQSKRLGEDLALAHQHEIPLVVLRPCAVYGPRDTDMFAYFKLVSRGIKPCFSGEGQYYSLCYVEDVVQAILLAATGREAKGEIFFVSDGRTYRMEEIGDALAGAMETRAIRIRVPKAILFGIASFSESLSRISGKPSLISKGKAEEMAQCDWGCDIAKARTLLGFEPRIGLSEGARRTAEWYREENWLKGQMR